jgi:molybdate/tungstate transport system substrate-binding protein
MRKIRPLLRRPVFFGVVAATALFIAPFAATSATTDFGAVNIANAGVLGSTVTALKTLVPGVTISNTTGGSVALAQGLESGTTVADIFGSADASVNQYLLGSANNNKETWFATIGRNAIVMQYSPSPSDPHAADFAKAAAGQEPWYQPLITGPPINLCRTSPDADPSGYYTLFVMQLAEKLYPKDAAALKQVLGDDRNPVQTSATCSTGRSLAAGTLDVSFTYLSGALSSPGTPFIRLPHEINLSDQAEAANYAKATFTNSAGQTFHGGVIRPSIAPIQGANNPVGADQVLQYMFQNQGRIFWWTFNFMPSGLYAGGDPTTIPADLRPYFNLRAEQVSVSPSKGACAKGRLGVSGRGVTVVGAQAQTSGQCLVTMDIATGETGVRDLVVMAPSTGATNVAKVDQTFTQAVDLSNAVPVVPDFLRAAPAK